MSWEHEGELCIGINEEELIKFISLHGAPGPAGAVGAAGPPATEQIDQLKYVMRNEFSVIYNKIDALRKELNEDRSYFIDA